MKLKNKIIRQILKRDTPIYSSPQAALAGVFGAVAKPSKPAAKAKPKPRR